MTFLNHGSFGACPLEVLTAQTQLREKLERDVHFFIREFETLLDETGLILRYGCTHEKGRLGEKQIWRRKSHVWFC
ncbi:hypothetical protein [Okeania sp. SIO3I5]|uniref:hypothetical protein n=1 Tax=Okeania sp. SIO3I5 TaxID=2607805 RepID=UPI00341BC43A